MHIHEDGQISIWLKCMLVCIVLVLPARCYTGYYLHALQTTSNLSVQYLNLVDGAVALMAIVLIFDKNEILYDYSTFRAVAVFMMVNLFMLLLIVIFGHVYYTGELISKSFIVLCAGAVASKVKDYTDTQKSSIYIISLLILVVASFFLSGYKEYGLMNRVGTVGFSTNETASFACCILAIALFVTNINVWMRLGASILSIACILNVASRRGMVVAIAVLLIWALILLWNKRVNKIALSSFFVASIIIGVGVAFIIVKHQLILNYISSSALVMRYRFAAKQNDEFMDITDRLSIYGVIIDYIKEHFFFGSYGCDKLLAQGQIAHAHNLFLQFIATNGILIGILYTWYVLDTFIKAIKMMKLYLDRKDNMFPAVLSLFFIIYFTFEMFGYLLWNPKGLFWIALTMFLIRIEYSNYVFDSVVISLAEKDY